LLKPCIDGAIRHVSREFGHDAARMYGCCAHAAITMTAVELD